MVRYLLEKYADIDVNLLNDDGESALATACEKRHLEIVKLLLRKSGVDVNLRYGSRKNTLLHYASEEGNLEIVKYLLENHADIDVNLLNDDGESALATACEKGHLEIVELLLQKSRVDVNVRYGSRKNTLLHYASKGGNLEIVKYLLENHADIDVNLLNDFGESALATACEKRHLEIVKFLLRKSGVDVIVRYGSRKDTLLHYASKEGNLEIVKYLLENRADIDVNLPNDDGESALATACEKGHLKIVKLLIQRSGVNVNVRYGSRKNTLLHYASKRGNLGIVKYLLENHADIDVNLLNDDGESAHTIACKERYLEIVKLLLRKSGVDVNVRYGSRKNVCYGLGKDTLLHYAYKRKNLENLAAVDVDLLNDDSAFAVEHLSSLTLNFPQNPSYFEFVEYLVPVETDVLSDNIAGSSALLHVPDGTLRGIESFCKRTEADVNFENKYGPSALKVLECETDPLKESEEITEQLRITKELLKR